MLLFFSYRDAGCGVSVDHFMISLGVCLICVAATETFFSMSLGHFKGCLPELTTPLQKNGDSQFSQVPLDEILMHV